MKITMDRRAKILLVLLLFTVLSFSRVSDSGVTWLLDVMIIPLGMLFLLYKLAIFFTDSFPGSARADKLERAVSRSLEGHLKQ